MGVAPESVPGNRGLRRRLGAWDAAAIYVGIILGSGIFWAPAQVAAVAPGAAAAAGLWLLGGLVAVCGAFCYAECAARLPYTGGFYVFYREVYGEGLAFIGGWAAIAITYPASIAAIALIFAQYLDEVLGGTPLPATVIAAASITLAGLLNGVGVRAGANAQRVLTAVKLAAMAMLCLAALVAFEPRGPVEQTGAFTLGAGPAVVLAALIGLLWTYDGWSDVTLVAGEIRRPGRDLGRAVAVGTLVLTAVYVLVQLSVQILLPAGQAAASGRVVADAVEAGLGSPVGRVVAGLIVISTLGSINGIVLAVSRLGFAMARDGVFPEWFGQATRGGVPLRSIVALTAVSIVHVFWAGLRDLLQLFSFSVWIFYGLTAVALLVLRRRGVGEPVEWSAPGGLAAPVVVLLTAAAMTGGLALQDPRSAVTSMLMLGAGAVVYLAWRRLRSSGRSGAQGGPSV